MNLIDGGPPPHHDRAMPRITISYRRDDSGVITGRIFDRLSAHYGRDSVFRDIDNIPPGADFRKHINEMLDASDIVLAIVGPKWIGPRANQSRLANAADPVRVEIETALRKDRPLIPVLVQRASMPRVDQLPETMQEFAYRNAVDVDTGRDFDHHMTGLIRAMDRILDQSGGMEVRDTGEITVSNPDVYDAVQPPSPEVDAAVNAELETLKETNRQLGAQIADLRHAREEAAEQARKSADEAAKLLPARREIERLTEELESTRSREQERNAAADDAAEKSTSDLKAQIAERDARILHLSGNETLLAHPRRLKFYRLTSAVLGVSLIALGGSWLIQNNSNDDALALRSKLESALAHVKELENSSQPNAKAGSTLTVGRVRIQDIGKGDYALKGVVITAVEGVPELEAGDIITAMNALPTRGKSEFQKVLELVSSLPRVTLNVTRKGVALGKTVPSTVFN